MKTNWENLGEAKKRRRCLPIICLIKLTGRIWEGPKGRKRCQPIICPANLPESFLLKSILGEQCTRHQEGPWVRDNQEAHPITIKPGTASRVAEQSFWVPLPCCSLPGRPFPTKLLALSAHVSPQTVDFWVFDKSPLSPPTIESI